jgi:protein-tyrosine phosphatase
MIDLHTHILPGVDDGVASLEEAVQLARSSWESGVRQIVATPHVRADYPTTRERIEAGVAEVRRALAEEGIPVEIHPGAEVDVDYAAGLDTSELERLTIGAAGRYVLVEVPYFGTPHALEGFASRLRRHRLVPVLAHPERSETFIDEPRRMLELADAGCLVQVTSGSLAGDAGRRVRNAARQLLELGIVNVVASDAHGPAIRRSGVREGVADLDPALASYLTEDAPADIVAGRQVDDPPRRERGRAGRWLRQAAARR